MNNLGLLRSLRGMSQTEMAQQIGVHRTLLSRSEQGWFIKPPNRMLEGIRRLFGESWTWETLMQVPTEPRPTERR